MNVGLASKIFYETEYMLDTVEAGDQVATATRSKGSKDPWYIVWMVHCHRTRRKFGEVDNDVHLSMWSMTFNMVRRLDRSLQDCGLLQHRSQHESTVGVGIM